MSAKYIRIDTSGTVDVLDGVGEKPSLEWMQEKVGGYVERVVIPKCEADMIDMYGDEEALIKEDSVYNRVASIFANRALVYTPADCYEYNLFGAFVLVGYNENKDGDMEWCWLTDSQVSAVLDKHGLREIATEVKGA